MTAIRVAQAVPAYGTAGAAALQGVAGGGVRTEGVYPHGVDVRRMAHPALCIHHTCGKKDAPDKCHTTCASQEFAVNSTTFSASIKDTTPSPRQ